METSSLCRICLAADVRMHLIVAGELQEMYESLSMTPLKTKDKRPTQACYICFSRLKNCYQLRQSCVHSEQLLTEILSGGVLKPVALLQHSSSKQLQIRPVEHTSLENEADACRGMDYAYELKLETAETEVIEEDQLVDNTVYGVDTVKVLVKKEPSESNADIAVEQNDADLYHSALGLHTECDIPLDIVKEEPDDVDTGTPRLAAQTYRKDTLLNSLKKTDQTMFKVEEPSRETKTDIAVKPIKKNEIVETRDNTDIIYNNKQNNSASDQNDAHKEMSDNIISADQRVNSKSSKKLKRFLCDTCQKCFNRKYHLKVHIRIHTGEKPYVCNVCKKCFIEKRNLEKHTRVHTGEKPYVCNVCKKCFAVKSYLVQHTRIHTGEKPYVCNVCKKCFAERSNLEKHTRIHTGKKPYECAVCKKCFVEKGNLEKHTRIHTGEKPYVCNVCKKCFFEKRALERHNLTHTGEKPYVCNVCEKCFTEKRYLKTHSHTHTCEKPYVCTVCEKCFSKKSCLKVHTGTHAIEKPYVCNVCKKGFTQKINLKSHTLTHTGEKPYECAVCKKCFTVKSCLEKHTRIHTGEKPYVCNICKKSFTVKSTLVKHTRTHTGEKPYECIVCRKCFRNKSHLNKHISIHTGENPLV